MFFVADGKRILVSGSIAYDNVMKYDGLFKDAILPEKLNHLSVAFTASKKSVQFGGCAGNIAYTLKLFGEDSLVLGAAGSDFSSYEQWLKKCGIDSAAIVQHPEEFTASATIITDKDQNQITIFHAGAMSFGPQALSVRDHNHADLALAIISPDDPHRMLRLAMECKELKIPYIFDPSQQLTSLSEFELREALSSAKVLIANEYEVELICKKLGMTKEQLPAVVPIFIETFGEKGSSIVSPEGTFFVRAVTPLKAAEPTGCGDAFRAGILTGMQLGFTIEKCCKIGSLAATYVLENEGSQNHKFTLDEFKKIFEESFGEGF